MVEHRRRGRGRGRQPCGVLRWHPRRPNITPRPHTVLPPPPLRILEGPGRVCAQNLLHATVDAHPARRASTSYTQLPRSLRNIECSGRVRARRRRPRGRPGRVQPRRQGGGGRGGRVNPLPQAKPPNSEGSERTKCARLLYSHSCASSAIRAHAERQRVSRILLDAIPGHTLQ